MRWSCRQQVRANVTKSLGYICDGHAGSEDVITEVGGITGMVRLLTGKCAQNGGSRTLQSF
jgi:hypothetical protein